MYFQEKEASMKLQKRIHWVLLDLRTREWKANEKEMYLGMRVFAYNICSIFGSFPSANVSIIRLILLVSLQFWIYCSLYFQVDRGVTLSEALLRHDKWLENKGIKNTNFAVVTWSNWDCRVMLESECRFKKIWKPPYFNRCWCSYKSFWFTSVWLHESFSFLFPHV